MGEGTNESVRARHAEFSQQFSQTDDWSDTLRKTLIVLIISISVWATCALLRYLSTVCSNGMFGLAEMLGYDSGFATGIGVLLVMLVAGLVRGILSLMPAWKNASGDGVEQMLNSYHETYEGGGDDPTKRYSEPTFMSAVRNFVMTVLTIGQGGSGGLESPGVFLGESLGAGWSKILKRPSAEELRLYQLSGIAAATATLLKAPFTAAIFAVELIFAGRIVYRLLAGCLIAGVVGFTLNNHLLGLGGLFLPPDHARIFVWQECLLVLLVAVGFSAPAVIAIGPTFRAADWLFSKIPTVLCGLAGVIVTWSIAVSCWWLVGLHPRHILGLGTETINEVVATTGDAVLRCWWILLLAVVAKLLATVATIRSGGSAGMLIPSMYMGGLAGAAAFALMNGIGLNVGPSHTVYVATGMAAALTLMAGVPLASIAFVIEIFGSEYGPAASLACAVCYTAKRRFSLNAIKETAEHTS